MKKAIGTFFMFLMLINQSTAQQNNNDDAYKNYFHVGFFQFFSGTFYVGYERMLNEKTSLLLSSGLTLVDQSYEERIGWQGNVEYRFFALSGTDNDSFFEFDGVYFGPYVKYKNLNVTEIDDSGTTEDENFKFQTVAGGVLVGVKITVTDRISFDFNLGGGIQYEFSDEENNNYWSGDIFSPGYTGVLPAANFTFGLKF